MYFFSTSKQDRQGFIKNVVSICLFFIALSLFTGCQSTSQNIPPHRPDVYQNGFPIIEIDVDFAFPFDWDGDVHDLQIFRDNWLGATLNVRNTHEDFIMTDVNIQARGRGNSTWWSFGEKRPVRFRFLDDEWQAMFDSPHVGRDWVTFANVADPSHLRNFAAYYLASMLVFDFTPQIWFVHLYLDGDYRGVYLLLDEREAIPGRGNLTLDENPEISEYMLEFDIRTRDEGDEVNTHWVDVRGPWDIRWPSTSAWMSEENNPHALYVENFLTRVDDAILNQDKDTLATLIDFDSFIDYYLVHEFMRNQDTRWSSAFFTIRGQNESRRLYAGPIWDFDLSAGSTFYVSSPIGSHAVRSYYGHSRMDWFYYLMTSDWFRPMVYERWNNIRDVEIRQTMDRIYYMTHTFQEDFNRNFERWPDQGGITYDWASSAMTRQVTGPLAQTESLLEWLEARILWLDEFFAE